MILTRVQRLSRGQSLVDLALIIGVIGIVFTSMQVYIKRGVQARVKQMTDHILSGEQSVGEDGAGDSSTNTTSSSVIVSESFKEGKKSLLGTENSVATYHSVN